MKLFRRYSYIVTPKRGEETPRKVTPIRQVKRPGSPKGSTVLVGSKAQQKDTISKRKAVRATMRGVFSTNNKQGEAPPSPLSSPVLPTRSMYHIPLKNNFDKKIKLPELAFWNTPSPSSQALKANLVVVFKRQKCCFFSTRSTPKELLVVLTKSGLIIYSKKHVLKGYTVALSDLQAIKALKVQKKKKKNSKEHCLIKLKWTFGSICLLLPSHLKEEWCQRLMAAFNDADGDDA